MGWADSLKENLKNVSNLNQNTNINNLNSNPKRSYLDYLMPNSQYNFNSMNRGYTEYR